MMMNAILNGSFPTRASASGAQKNGPRERAVIYQTIRRVSGDQRLLLC
jgi:hypothetical protein